MLLYIRQSQKTFKCLRVLSSSSAFFFWICVR